jgi:DNA-directed RNA polymerase subunit M/transcription elongation factor TFIIS
MNFCDKCDNMYYMKINDDEKSENQGQLIYYCRNCGHEESNVNLKNLCISVYEDNATSKTNKFNSYTKYDPTLPHSHTIRCPNDVCPSNSTPGSPSDVIYIRVDDINMKYMYLCTFCEKNWMP